MKKLLTVVLAVCFLATLSTGVFAAEQTSGDTATLKTQRTAFKTQIQPLRNTLKANHDQNQALRDQNKALRTQIKDKLASLKTSETKLSEETKLTIKGIRQEIKTLQEEKAATKGQIKEILTADKANIKSMDYAAVEAAFNKSYDIQKFRFEKLTQINNKLNEIIAAIK